MIITIGRQYGAGGREVAEKLAKELQIPLYDRKLVAFISAHLEKGVSLDELDLTYENLYGSVSPYETMFGDLNVEDDNYLFTPQSKAIKALAQKGSGIFLMHAVAQAGQIVMTFGLFLPHFVTEKTVRPVKN